MCQKEELEQRTKELEDCKAQNDLERRGLMDEIEEVCENFYVPATFLEISHFCLYL